MVQLHYDKDEQWLKAKRGKSVKMERPDGKKYLVCHVSKFKRSDVVGMYKHIQREMKTTTNEDIEPHKTALNYDLSGFNKKTMNYSDEIEKRLRERFKGKKAIRKDATVMIGVIVSATPELFEDMTEQQERLYFQTAFDFLANHFGRENIISATVHKDEKTPHLHLNFVPLTQDGRLSAKEMVDQKTLLHLQENLPKELQAMGFEVSRGLPSKQTGAKHENPRDWKIRTGKNELERTERITTARTRRTNERKRIVDEQNKRAEQREQYITSLKNENSRNTEERNRIQDRNSENRSDLKNVGIGGFDLGGGNRVQPELTDKVKIANEFKRSNEKINAKQRQVKNQKQVKDQGGFKL